MLGGDVVNAIVHDAVPEDSSARTLDQGDGGAVRDRQRHRGPDMPDGPGLAGC